METGAIQSESRAFCLTSDGEDAIPASAILQNERHRESSCDVKTITGFGMIPKWS